MFKKFIICVVVMTMVVPLFQLQVRANDSMSLPVQFFDYDADGLFYEYALYNGMDTFGLGTSNNEDVTKGLVEKTLGKDGNPVYKRSAIESAASTIHENLINLKDDQNLNKYDIFKKFSNYSNASGSVHTSLSGSDTKPFYKNWKLENIDGSGDGEYLHSGNGVVWQQETDGVLNYGVNDHLIKEINVVPNTEYKFHYWITEKAGASNELKYRVLDKNGKVLLDNNPIDTVFKSSTDTITIDIYRVGQTKDVLKFSNVYLIRDDSTFTENYLGNIESSSTSNFIDKGWKSQLYNQASKENGKIVDGKNYWQQKGDGIICLNDSAIYFDTDIPTNQYIKFNYWLDEQSNNGSLSIDILDENNHLLVSKEVDKNGGWQTFLLDIPSGQGNIKVRINGQGVSPRMAALSVTPMGQVLPLGQYQETLNKYNNNQLNVIDDCKTCMDYAFLRLTNFYNTHFYLNKTDTTYSKMILNKTVNNGREEYLFDSSKPITYKNGEFYNDGNGILESGFFPLDYLSNSEKHSDGQVDHNFHFGMKVDGEFIYKQSSKQFFEFTGDDDVYVFINGHLVADLGGAHKAANTIVNIEDFAKEQGIKNGEKCHLQFFYLERHTTASNCKIQTNLNIGKRVEYKFESGTPNMTLPNSIYEYVPIDEKEYYYGQQVSIDLQNRKFKDIRDDTNKGVWRFIGWDHNSKIMSNDALQFVGKWVFISDEELQKQIQIVSDTHSNQNKKTQINTGDQTQIVLYCIIAVIALLGIVIIIKKAHK